MRRAFRNAFFLSLLMGMASANTALANVPLRYEAIIANHALANDIPLNLARAVVKHESAFDPDATGQAGEIGLMQIKLATARLMGFKGSAADLYDPATNIRYGMKYLGEARELAGGSECGTLSKYNGGHGTRRMIRGYCSKVRLAMRG